MIKKFTLYGFLIAGFAGPMDFIRWLPGIAHGSPLFSDDENAAEETPEEEEEEQVPDSVLEDEVMTLSQEEIQAKFQHAAALGVGVAQPWQEYAFSYHNRIEGRYFTSIHFGGGGFDFEGDRLSRSYRQSTQSHSAIGGLRWYFTSMAPLFIQPFAGLIYWHGDVSPKGSDPDTDTTAAKLDASFYASGLMAGANFGITWMWENGFFLEYSIFRIGRAVVLSKSFTGGTDAAEAVVVENLERWLSWGYANITLGWSF